MLSSSIVNKERLSLVSAYRLAIDDSFAVSAKIFERTARRRFLSDHKNTLFALYSYRSESGSLAS